MPRAVIPTAYHSSVKAVLETPFEEKAEQLATERTKNLIGRVVVGLDTIIEAPRMKTEPKWLTGRGQHRSADR